MVIFKTASELKKAMIAIEVLERCLAEVVAERAQLCNALQVVKALQSRETKSQ